MTIHLMMFVRRATPVEIIVSTKSQHVGGKSYVIEVGSHQGRFENGVRPLVKPIRHRSISGGNPNSMGWIDPKNEDEIGFKGHRRKGGHGATKYVRCDVEDVVGYNDGGDYFEDDKDDWEVVDYGTLNVWVYDLLSTVYSLLIK